jgi:hypothetical protein
MKPWITEAIGTQKTSLPSSVIQALLATSEKFSMPGRSLSDGQVSRARTGRATGRTAGR